MKTLMQGYRAWCAKRGLLPLALSDFLDEIEKICGQIGVEIKVGSDKRVYCLGVKLESTVAVTTH